MKKDRTMVIYNNEHKLFLEKMFMEHPDLKAGKMFGFPAWYVGKKLCMCVYENGVGIKLPEKIILELLEKDPNAIPFQPYGKAKMRQWIQINLERSEDYLKYRELFDESIRFIFSGTKE